MGNGCSLWHRSIPPLRCSAVGDLVASYCMSGVRPALTARTVRPRGRVRFEVSPRNLTAGLG